jgi:hypothetical protein
MLSKFILASMLPFIANGRMTSKYCSSELKDFEDFFTGPLDMTRYMVDGEA